MENQTEKEMETEMGTGSIYRFVSKAVLSRDGRYHI